jgi:hypothetical protein
MIGSKTIAGGSSRSDYRGCGCGYSRAHCFVEWKEALRHQMHNRDYVNEDGGEVGMHPFGIRSSRGGATHDDARQVNSINTDGCLTTSGEGARESSLRRGVWWQHKHGEFSWWG